MAAAKSWEMTGSFRAAPTRGGEIRRRGREEVARRTRSGKLRPKAGER
uniref:Uncharacterized protein n=1 Tax=Arundo donax TaxID=35708 RepID=A0A0A8ZMY9_ARUDO